MNLAALILKLGGWHLQVDAPDYPKCLICVAPHTSNWDFILCKLAYAAVHRHAGFLMKETWFFPPLGWFFRSIGGIPVPRKRGSSLSDEIVKKFGESKRLHLAITPEGTRSLTHKWRTGFLRIAYQANVPIVLAVLDFGRKKVYATETFTATGNIDNDMRAIKQYYRNCDPLGYHPQKFSAKEKS